jgi:hypothetical protein
MSTDSEPGRGNHPRPVKQPHRLAEQRITRRLTPAERKLYLAGIRG